MYGEKRLRTWETLNAPVQKRVSSPYKERQLKVLRESDRRIVLRDGRADHKGKAATKQCSS